MEVLEGGLCLHKILIILTITLISPPDQCEATKCYTCGEQFDASHQGPFSCPNAQSIDCSESPPCASTKITVPGRGFQYSQGCNTVPDCFKDKLGIGKGNGCVKVTGKQLLDFCSADTIFPAEAILEHCACSGENCNGGEFKFTGGGGGGEGTLKRTATGTALMMTSVAIVGAAVLLP